MNVSEYARSAALLFLVSFVLGSNVVTAGDSRAEPLIYTVRARENWFRQGHRIQAISLQWQDTQNGPIVVSGLDVSFLGSGERWIHRKEQRNITKPLVLPLCLKAQPAPITEFPEWLEEFEGKTPPVVDVTDGGRHLTANPQDVRGTRWNGQINAELDRFARRGVCNGWLLWSQSWLSSSLARWELIATEGDAPNAPSGWVFSTGRTEAGIEHFARLRCTAGSMLPIEMVWSVTRTESTVPRANLLAPTADRPISVPDAERELMRVLVTETLETGDGIELPVRTLRRFAYGVTGPCHSRFDYHELTEAERAPERFDPRGRVEEAAEHTLLLYDVVTNEVILHHANGRTERHAAPPERGASSAELIESGDPAVDYALAGGALLAAVFLLIRRRRVHV